MVGFLQRNAKRKLKDITSLKESISKIGLINPILITPTGNLLAGEHRFKACKELGWKTIPAIITTNNKLKCELMRIDENLVRYELSTLERAEHLGRRKEIYESIYPETKRGGLPGKAGGGKKAKSEIISSFAKDTASKTGRSERTVQQEVQIATNIIPELKEVIKGTPMEEKKKDLLKLARMEPEKQKKIYDSFLKTKEFAFGEETMTPDDISTTLEVEITPSRERSWNLKEGLWKLQRDWESASKTIRKEFLRWLQKNGELKK